MNYLIQDIANEHLAQLHREAEENRRANRVQSDGRSVYHPALAELGRRLSSMGQHLEERYGARTPSDLAGQYH